jgi:hypothetical protein
MTRHDFGAGKTTARLSGQAPKGPGKLKFSLPPVGKFSQGNILSAKIFLRHGNPKKHLITIYKFSQSYKLKQHW